MKFLELFSGGSSLINLASKFGIFSLAVSLASLLPAHEASAAKLTFPENYDSLSACEKESILWNDFILPTEYTTLPPLAFLDLFNFSIANMNTTVSRVADSMPEGRLKHIHKYGVVAAVKFEADPKSPFTGLFKGAECGLLRAGLAIAPTLVSPVLPGAALKLFIDGQPSKNFPFMPGLDGQGNSYNFFRDSFFTSIGNPKNPAIQVLKKVFERASKTPLELSLNHLSTFKESGEKEVTRLAPKVVEFVPSKGSQFPDSPKRDNRIELQSIAEGTEMFRAYDFSTGVRGNYLGRIVLKTKFKASEWGDGGLFFKHQRLEDAAQD